jgi:hypothetical protein
MPTQQTTKLSELVQRIPSLRYALAGGEEHWFKLQAAPAGRLKRQLQEEGWSCNKLGEDFIWQHSSSWHSSPTEATK